MFPSGPELEERPHQADCWAQRAGLPGSRICWDRIVRRVASCGPVYRVGSSWGRRMNAPVGVVLDDQQSDGDCDERTPRP
jgi:hypothetical protein